MVIIIAPFFITRRLRRDPVDTSLFFFQISAALLDQIVAEHGAEQKIFLGGVVRKPGFVDVSNNVHTRPVAEEDIDFGLTDIDNDERDSLSPQLCFDVPAPIRLRGVKNELSNTPLVFVQMLPKTTHQSIFLMKPIEPSICSIIRLPPGNA
jgi:hypothetical protein